MKQHTITSETREAYGRYPVPPLPEDYEVIGLRKPRKGEQYLDASTQAVSKAGFDFEAVRRLIVRPVSKVTACAVPYCRVSASEIYKNGVPETPPGFEYVRFGIPKDSEQWLGTLDGAVMGDLFSTRPLGPRIVVCPVLVTVKDVYGTWLPEIPRGYKLGSFRRTIWGDLYLAKLEASPHTHNTTWEDEREEPRIILYKEEVPVPVPAPKTRITKDVIYNAALKQGGPVANGVPCKDLYAFVEKLGFEVVNE